MKKPQPYYRRVSKHSGTPLGILLKLLPIVLVAALLVSCGVVFVPRLVHHCDNCDQLFFGTGYRANIVSNALSTITGKDNKILCRACAEKDHAIEILAGKSVEDFKLPLFEKKGD